MAQEGTPIFDGKSLDGWDGDPRFWKVEDGAIVGQTTKEVPTEGNTFLIWSLGEVDDFELTAEYKLEEGNTGIQVRSFRLPDKKWGIGGYQADIDFSGQYAGIIYGEAFRGILAQRGEKSVIGEDHKPSVPEGGKFAEHDSMKALSKPAEWNTIKVVAKGWTVQNYLNGTLTAQVTDNDVQVRRRGGLLALQLHAGPPMKVSYRNIRLKRTPLGDVKKVVFMAGRPSHAKGDHEHRAGSMLLSGLLNECAGDKFYATVSSNGWSGDPTILDNADALIMYCDGGGGHMVNNHLDQVKAANDRGMGIGCIHYGVEVEKGPSGDAFLNWIGGYFEMHHSVNPHWTADFKTFPGHPVAHGLKPFSINDEWYFNMRFREGMKNVTPILSAVPPAETMNRPDGPHSGNPGVREAVKRGDAQHMMWVSENENGTRGFGFTGAHYHKGWKDDNFRKAVVNGIAWISKVEVPADGLQTRTPSDAEMEANLDAK